MLSKFDDYPIHQTPLPIAQPATGDRNAYDRYWFNGYQDDGEFYFGIGAALYPNLGILDCGFSIVRDGEQHAFHASRRAPHEPTELRSDRSRSRSLEPMRTPPRRRSTTTTPASPPTSRSSPRTASIEEGRQIRHAGPRLDDGRHPLRAVRAVGGRDHATRARRSPSTPRACSAPRTAAGACARSACPTPGPRRRRPARARRSSSGRRSTGTTAARTTACSRTRTATSGTPTARCCRCTTTPPTSPAPRIPAPSCSRASTTTSTTCRARGGPATRASVWCTPDGTREDVDLEPLICFRMKGIGYMHPEWGHGMWKGELAIGGESWKVDDLDPMAFENQHLQQVVRATQRRRGPASACSSRSASGRTPATASRTSSTPRSRRPAPEWRVVSARVCRSGRGASCPRTGCAPAA